jgi:hypothetical protein
VIPLRLAHARIAGTGGLSGGGSSGSSQAERFRHEGCGPWVGHTHRGSALSGEIGQGDFHRVCQRHGLDSWMRLAHECHEISCDIGAGGPANQENAEAPHLIDCVNRIEGSMNREARPSEAADLEPEFPRGLERFVEQQYAPLESQPFDLTCRSNEMATESHIQEHFTQLEQ